MHAVVCAGTHSQISVRRYGTSFLFESPMNIVSTDMHRPLPPYPTSLASLPQQTMTHPFVVSAQMRFDTPLKSLSYALALRATHPNGNLSATLNNQARQTTANNCGLRSMRLEPEPHTEWWHGVHSIHS